MANKENDDTKVKCPKCDSTQFHSSDKGFSTGKAVTGAVLTGGIGLLAGLHGSKKVVLTCLKCGNKWNPFVSTNKNEKNWMNTPVIDPNSKAGSIYILSVVGLFIGMIILSIIAFVATGITGRDLNLSAGDAILLIVFVVGGCTIGYPILYNKIKK